MSHEEIDALAQGIKAHASTGAAIVANPAPAPAGPQQLVLTTQKARRGEPIVIEPDQKEVRA